MQDLKKNKFTIGTLVTYNFPNIIGIEEKVGIVIEVKSSPLYTWVYIVKWNSGDEQVYPELHLKGVD